MRYTCAMPVSMREGKGKGDQQKARCQGTIEGTLAVETETADRCMRMCGVLYCFSHACMHASFMLQGLDLEGILRGDHNRACSRAMCLCRAWTAGRRALAYLANHVLNFAVAGGQTVLLDVSHPRRLLRIGQGIALLALGALQLRQGNGKAIEIGLGGSHNETRDAILGDDEDSSKIPRSRNQLI